MTSATGERGMVPGSRGGRRRAGGFTIVEVLMVVGILTIVAALVVVATQGLRTKANREATRALIQRLKDGLEEYRRAKGAYPPDGLDFDVKNAQGEAIWGSACLYEFLAKEIQVEEMVSGQVRRSVREPVMRFSGTELKKHEDQPGVFEVIDGFNLPLHYDNTENNQFDPAKQKETAHIEPEESHPDDPRDDPGLVARRGIQRPGAYDLWSHGSKDGHSDEADPKLTIGSWDVDVEKSGKSEEDE